MTSRKELLQGLFHAIEQGKKMREGTEMADKKLVEANYDRGSKEDREAMALWVQHELAKGGKRAEMTKEELRARIRARKEKQRKPRT